MPKFWDRIAQTVSILTISLFYLSTAEARAIPQTKTVSIKLQNKLNLNKVNRQANSIDNFDLKLDNIPFLITQANNIEQLKDIKLTDWSYQALRNLIERYGCISGFSDKPTLKGTPSDNGMASQRTYRGERVISRAEFAAGLNACLNQIEIIIADPTAVPETDVDTILRLMQEFQSDLAILKGTADGSQARLQDLEATQVSTTTKLKGEAIFGLGSILSEDKDNTNTILGSRLRLELATSFEGNDLLVTRLSRNDFTGFAEETEIQGSLAFAEPNDDDGDLQLDALHYSFDLGDRFNFIVGASGLEADDIAPTINFLDGDGGSGSISTFGTRNPIYYPPGDAGLGITHTPIEQIEIAAGYIASSANDPNPGSGLFDGGYSALGQVTVEPFASLSLAATYVHSYNQSDTATGTNRANLRSETADLFGSKISTVSNSYGLELSWEVSDRLVVGGWGGLSKVSNLSTLEGQIDRGTQDIWNWAGTLALPDLGKEGSLGGIVVGSEPKVTNSTIDGLDSVGDRSLHLEAFYQYQVNDNISVTPGVVWITEPDSKVRDSDDLVIGTVRTTFSF